jgi:hypothetical protein
MPGNRYVQLEIVFRRNEGGSEITHPVRMEIHYDDEDSPYEIEDFKMQQKVNKKRNLLLLRRLDRVQGRRG